MTKPVIDRGLQRLRRRPGAAGMGSTLLLALVLSCGGSGPQNPAAGLPEEGRPNVLLITIDTLRADRVGAYDPSRVLTPHIDSLAASGATFLRAFTHNPVTLPAHVNILLGQTPLAHGVHDNGRFAVPAKSVTLTEILKKEGYATGAFIGGYPLHSRFGLNQGFEVYDDRFQAGDPSNREFAEIKAGQVADRALAWLSGRSSPWFLWVHLFDPHNPYEPPEPFKSRYEKSPYDGEVAYTDEVTGRLLKSLEEKHFADKTLIVLTGDHGESLGEHGELTHGFLAYNTTLWVPLIIRSPGLKPSKILEPVSHIDIVPTVCEILGLAGPGGLQGRSLLPAMNGRRLSPTAIYFESLSPYYSRGWAPIRGFIDGAGRMKFIDSPIPEIYDLGKDFVEAENLTPGRDVANFRKSLDTIIRSRTTDGSGESRQKLDPAAVEKLRSLGYLAGPSSAREKTSYGPEDDVKTLLPYHERAMAALELSRTGKDAEAVQKLKEVITERPATDVAYVNLALVYENMGRPAEALEVLRSGLASLPESYDLLSHQVRFLVVRGDYRGAAALAESHALAQMEEDLKIWIDLGIAYRNLKEFNKSEAAYQTALAIDPTYPVIHNNLGTLHLAVYLESGEPSALESAIEDFEKAAELDPTYAAAYYGMGQARYQARDFDRVIEAMHKALEIDPGLPDASFYLGLSYYRKGLLKEAVPHLEMYREKAGRSLDPEDLQKLDELIEKCRSKK